jgi:hypothetical protein
VPPYLYFLILILFLTNLTPASASLIKPDSLSTCQIFEDGKPASEVVLQTSDLGEIESQAFSSSMPTHCAFAIFSGAFPSDDLRTRLCLIDGSRVAANYRPPIPPPETLEVDD